MTKIDNDATVIVVNAKYWDEDIGEPLEDGFAEVYGYKGYVGGWPRSHSWNLPKKFELDYYNWHLEPKQEKECMWALRQKRKLKQVCPTIHMPGHRSLEGHKDMIFLKGLVFVAENETGMGRRPPRKTTHVLVYGSPEGTRLFYSTQESEEGVPTEMNLDLFHEYLSPYDQSERMLFANEIILMWSKDCLNSNNILYKLHSPYQVISALLIEF